MRFTITSGQRFNDQASGVAGVQIAERTEAFTLREARDKASVAIDRAWGPYADPPTQSVLDDGRHAMLRARAITLTEAGGEINLPNGAVVIVKPEPRA
jgi:hypothetical protein